MVLEISSLQNPGYGKIPVSISSGNIPEFHFTEQISGSFHFQLEFLLRNNGNPSFEFLICNQIN